MEQDQLLAALPQSLKERISSARMVAGRAVIVADGNGFSDEQAASFEQAVIELLSPLEGVGEVRVALMRERKRLRMIAIGSGKGGVGKSTVTANLAVALARAGHKVGVVDADIYGPSQPKLLATENQKLEARDDRLVPLESPHGVKVLSMGQLVSPGKALAWRGPMAGTALGQLIDGHWGDTELLLIDLPPGTGDVQLSMMQKHKPDGALLVSTPQDLALIDAARAGQLFEQGEIPIIGLVENMAGYACPHCGEMSDPFGQGGVEHFAERLEIPFWGRIPLAMSIRKDSDAGLPPAAGDGAEAEPFNAIAAKLSAWLQASAQS